MTSEGGAKKQKIVRDAAYEAHPSTCLRTSQGSIFRIPDAFDSGFGNQCAGVSGTCGQGSFARGPHEQQQPSLSTEGVRREFFC